MGNRVPRFVYFGGAVLGIPALVVSLWLIPIAWSTPAKSVATGAVFGLFALIAGFLLPVGSWRWGLALVIPMIVLLGVSVGFAGYLGVFLSKDVPVLLGAAIGGCLGGYVGGALQSARK